MGSPENPLEFFKKEAIFFQGRNCLVVTGMVMEEMREKHPMLHAATLHNLRECSDEAASYAKTGAGFGYQTMRRYPYKEEYQSTLEEFAAQCVRGESDGGYDFYPSTSDGWAIRAAWFAAGVRAFLNAVYQQINPSVLSGQSAG